MMRGTVPLDMSQYSKLFTTARYPQQGEDYVMTTLFLLALLRTHRTLSSCPCGSRCATIDCHFRAGALRPRTEQQAVLRARCSRQGVQPCAHREGAAGADRADLAGQPGVQRRYDSC